MRRSTILARLVLAWFVLWLGVGVVAPAFGASALQLVCSGGSFKLALQGTDPADERPLQVVHCPACGPTMVPAAGEFRADFRADGGTAAPDAPVATAIAQSSWAPGSARGPPSLS